MKAIFPSIMLLYFSFSQGQTKGQIPPDYSNRLDSEHFVFLWNSDKASQEEIERTKAYSEEIFVSYGNLVGSEHMPDRKIIVTFNGDAFDPVTRRKTNSGVDYQARVNLYRYNEYGYTGPLLHEYIHAFRKNTLNRWVRFFEEGFASAISYYLEPETEEFSRQGFAMEVLAGYWLDTGTDIPMRTLREQHNNLLHCRIQSYVLREDFFTYLINRFGIEKYLEFAYSPRIGSIELYEDIWGSSFDELVSDWEPDLLKRYRDYPGAKEQAEQYLQMVPAKYVRVCEAGVDF